MQLKNTKDISIKDAKKKWLIYGSSGSGKTTFAGTFPSPVFLDLDDKMTPLLGKDIPFYSFKGEPPGSVWFSIMKALKEAIGIEGRSTIVIDSLTSLSDAAMASVQLLSSTSGKMPSQPEYGAQLVKIKEFLSLLLSAEKNIVVTAHEKITKDELLGRIWSTPMVTGQLSGTISRYFDEVYHSEVVTEVGKEASYRLLMRSNNIYTGKTSFRGISLMRLYFPPSFEDIQAFL